MKTRALALSCVLFVGCAANIYRANTDTAMCESVVATDCADAPGNANRIRLCGSAFANHSDFEAAALTYCEHPTLQNCAVQCCDVACPDDAPPPPPPAAPAAPSAASPPAPAAATDEMPPPPPPAPLAPAPPAPPPAASAPAPAPAAPATPAP